MLSSNPLSNHDLLFIEEIENFFMFKIKFIFGSSCAILTTNMIFISSKSQHQESLALTSLFYTIIQVLTLSTSKLNE